VVTASDQLATRDAQTMAPVFATLGLSTGYMIDDPVTGERKSYDAYNPITKKYTGSERDTRASYLNPETGRRMVDIQYVGGFARMGFDFMDSVRALNTKDAPVCKT